MSHLIMWDNGHQSVIAFPSSCQRDKQALLWDKLFLSSNYFQKHGWALWGGLGAVWKPWVTDGQMDGRLLLRQTPVTIRIPAPETRRLNDLSEDRRGQFKTAQILCLCDRFTEACLLLPARRLDRIVKRPRRQQMREDLSPLAVAVKILSGPVPLSGKVSPSGESRCSVSASSPLPAPSASSAAERWRPPWPRSWRWWSCSCRRGGRASNALKHCIDVRGKLLTCFTALERNPSVRDDLTHFSWVTSDDHTWALSQTLSRCVQCCL